jgi:FdhD protein
MQESSTLDCEQSEPAGWRCASQHLMVKTHHRDTIREVRPGGHLRREGIFLVTDADDGKLQLTVDFEAQRYNRGVLEAKQISLAREVPYTLFVNDTEILSIATLPSNLKELFVGFLVSERVLFSPNEIRECAVDHASRLVRLELDVPDQRRQKLEKKGMLTSGCAGGVVFSVEAAIVQTDSRPKPITVTCSEILARMAELDTYPGIYRVTRGVHAASVADVHGTLMVLEDLGRHNAVDKIVGYCFLNQMETRDKLLLTTGRITSEVLTKAAASRFPVIVSRSSASALAVNIARQSGIDVFTYVRGGRFNHFPHGAADLQESA